MGSFGARGVLRVRDADYEVFRIDAVGGAERLPLALRVLLENLLRAEADGRADAEDVRALAAWSPREPASRPLPVSPARVLLDGAAGVAAVADLAALRDAADALGGDPARVAPRVSTEIVVDRAATPEHLRLLRWGRRALDRLRVVPPGSGACEQVDLEHLARVVCTRGGPRRRRAFPDIVLGTDPRTTLVNGLGVLGWSVPGIEAEAALLGRPAVVRVPAVVGVRLVGELPPGVTGTDLVLALAELLGGPGLDGALVEFTGASLGGVAVPVRAALASVVPEFGATAAFFPVDAETLRYLRLTGRSEARLALVEAYAKEQGLWHAPGREPGYSRMVELDLGTVEPSVAGIGRLPDRVPLRRARAAFAADPAAPGRPSGARPPGPPGDAARAAAVPPADEVPGPGIELPDGTRTRVAHDDVVVAAISACAGSADPAGMIAAGLLARKAVELGLVSRPWVRTSLVPGSRAVAEYLRRADLTPYLDELGFALDLPPRHPDPRGGPLIPEVAAAVRAHGLAVGGVHSGGGDRAAEQAPVGGTKLIASPPLVIAYALAGTLRVDLTREPIARGLNGREVFLRDIWPSPREVAALVADVVHPDLYAREYADVLAAAAVWRDAEPGGTPRFSWDTAAPRVGPPPLLDGAARDPGPVSVVAAARPVAVLGDGATAEQVAPSGPIPPGSPAAEWLAERGISPEDAGTAAGWSASPEVLARLAFTGAGLRNLLDLGAEHPGRSGGRAPAFERARRCAADGAPAIVIAGSGFGSGALGDRAARAVRLLGVRAVLATSFDPRHRAALVALGVAPLEFLAGDSPAALGLRGDERFTLALADPAAGTAALPAVVAVTAAGDRGGEAAFSMRLAVETPEEAARLRHGGVLPLALRELLDAAAAAPGAGGAERCQAPDAGRRGALH